MCLAIPARIESITGLEAKVEIGGAGRTISLWLTPEVEVGSCVYIHNGYAISVVDEAEALESLRLLRALTETYPVDELYYSREICHRRGNLEVCDVGALALGKHSPRARLAGTALFCCPTQRIAVELMKPCHSPGSSPGASLPA
jgi:hydrogenase expression/formation protein HypC